jgi:hypothetical protein
MIHPSYEISYRIPNYKFPNYKIPSYINPRYQVVAKIPSYEIQQLRNSQVTKFHGAQRLVS